MAKICGVFSFIKKRLVDFELSSILQSLIRSEDEVFSSWFENNIGLGQLQPASESSSQSNNFSSDKNTKIVADAVLTNRRELFQKLGISQSDQTQITDSQLILKSYEKWNENCAEYLVGDFAFAIWDEQNKKLFCSRDHLGGSTFFYYKDNERFIFASEPKGILSSTNVEKKFNKNKLAIFLLPEPHTLLTDQSWFENVFPLPAGTNLTVDENSIKIRRFWKPELGNSLPYKNDEEILEAFRELFFQIIEAHLGKKSPTASLLSGGLDSSSIVCVAAKILERQNREINVFAGVLADENDNEFSDERYFINQFKSFPNVKINYVSASEAGPFSNLETLFENFHSPLITSRHYLYTTFCKEAYKIGAKTLFDGAFGETGATFHGQGGFAEMFANLKWLTLWRELKLRKSLYGDSIKYNLRANVINPFLPQFLIDLRRGKTQDKLQTVEFHPFQEDFAQSLLKNLDFSKQLSHRASPNHRKNQLNEINFLQEKISESPSLHFGKEPIEMRYPLLDKRLIEFCLAVPLNLKIRNGFYRYLIRAGLDKILPPEIQWRTTKTPFSPDYVRRFNSQIGMVREFLADIKSNDPLREILDIEKLKKWANLPIANSERYTNNERIARDYLPQAIYLIYFLRKFSDYR